MKFSKICSIKYSMGLMTLAVLSKCLLEFVQSSPRLLLDLPALFVSGDSKFLCPSLMSSNFASVVTSIAIVLFNADIKFSNPFSSFVFHDGIQNSGIRLRSIFSSVNV